MAEIVKEYGKVLIGVFGALGILVFILFFFLGVDTATNQTVPSMLGQGIGRYMDSIL